METINGYVGTIRAIFDSAILATKEAIHNHLWIIRVMVYALSMVLAVCIVVAGNMAQNPHQGAVPLGFYGAWLLSATLLACFCYRDADTAFPFILQCWCYLGCTAIILVFLRSLGTIDPANIHLWVPVSFDLGIFLAQGLLALYSCVTTLSRPEGPLHWTMSSDERRRRIRDEEQGPEPRQHASSTATAIGTAPNERCCR